MHARHCHFKLLELKLDSRVFKSNYDAKGNGTLMATKRPKIIGIVGGSGSGKTTVTKRIIDELTQDKVALIEQDYYYKDQSHMTMDERVKTNYDHPSAFDNELLYNHLLELMDGKAVELPVYDYVNHTRSKEQKTSRT